MNYQHRDNVTPSDPEIRAALGRVLASPPFRNSPQLLAFLRFVVESTLAGEAEHIKSYTIAVEALGRDQSFDPQADPIVRVEAGRLRRALEHYYAGSGMDDPVIIDLPLGAYVPGFRHRTEHQTPVPAGGWRHRITARTLVWAVFIQSVALFGGGVFLATDWWSTAIDSNTASTSSPSSTGRASAATLPSHSGMPLVVVQQHDATAEPAKPAIMLDGLGRRLRDALSRFDEIEVASELMLPESGQFSTLLKEFGAHSVYRLATTAEYDNDAVKSLSFRLHDASNGTVIWARTFEDVSAAARNEIIRTIATELAQPYGVIYARERTKLAGGNVDPRYRCVIEAFEYWRGFDRTQASGVRACLEKVTALDPTFAEGFAILGLLNLRDYYEPESSPSDTLDPALVAAQRAVDLKPQSARAHHALMAALFARGNIPAAFAEGEKMISLNPSDMLLVQAYGMRLVISGHLEKGTALLHQVAVSTPVRTPKFEFSLFLSEYMLGRHENAAFHPRLFTSDDYPLLLVARAVAAVWAGVHNDARRAIDRLIKLHPGWRDNPRDRLTRYIPAPEIVDRLAQDLAAAGLFATH